MKPRILFLVSSDYEDLLQKGVAPFLQEREENGFFERVVTLHPWAQQTRALDLSPRHRLYELKESFLPFCSAFKTLRYPHHLFHLVKVVRVVLHLIDHERINLIRATDPALTGLLAWVVTRLRPMPFCISIHADYEKRFHLDSGRGAPTLFGSRRLARWMERFTLRRASRVWPIRQSLADQAIAQGVSASRVRVIPHGIDLTPFQDGPSGLARQALSLPAAHPILSFAGRLSRENYVHDILHLAQELKKTRSDFVVVMAGDGPERPALEKCIAENTLHDVVKLVGFQPREMIISLRKESTLSLCLMGGYSLIEACAAGRPVIAYDVEWHSELVRTGETGYRVPEKESPELLKAVQYLLDHKTEADRMGAAARALAFEKHDARNVSALKCRYYAEMLTAS